MYIYLTIPLNRKNKVIEIILLANNLRSLNIIKYLRKKKEPLYNSTEVTLKEFKKKKSIICHNVHREYMENILYHSININKKIVILYDAHIEIYICPG